MQDVKIDSDFSSFSLMKSNIIIGSELYERYNGELIEDEFRNLVNREYKILLDFESVIDLQMEIDRDSSALIKVTESKIDLAQLIQRSYIALLLAGGILLVNLITFILVTTHH